MVSIFARKQDVAGCAKHKEILMGLLPDDDAAFYQQQHTDLSGIHALLTLVHHSVPDQPVGTALTYLIARLSRAVTVLETWHSNKRVITMLATTCLMLYSCAPDWTIMDWLNLNTHLLEQWDDF